MKKVAIIGAGISGLSAAQLLKDRFLVTVFEQGGKPGGLVKCDRIEGNLFHRVGGHVFNSRNQEVLDWFWGFFDRDQEFLKAQRNAKIFINGKVIGYPIEDYLYEFPAETVSAILDDLLHAGEGEYLDFEAFLRGNFGKTLYELYFGPYNQKIWHTDLSEIPLEWLEGKLPMPDIKQILLRNITRQVEKQMVHSTFYYAKENGSQFIIDRISEGLDIRVNTPVTRIENVQNGWTLNGQGTFDHIVYCGDVRKLKNLIHHNQPELGACLASVSALRSNSTSNLFCECDSTDRSWMYLPGKETQAHRIIYTGGFSPTNNGGVTRQDRMTCVVEFSGEYTQDEMELEVSKLPGNLSPLASNHEKNSYIIHHKDTRDQITALKKQLALKQFHLLGRFAEWEYYNMDKAIEAAMGLRKKLEEEKF